MREISNIPWEFRGEIGFDRRFPVAFWKRWHWAGLHTRNRPGPIRWGGMEHVNWGRSVVDTVGNAGTYPKGRSRKNVWVCANCGNWKITFFISNFFPYNSGKTIQTHPTLASNTGMARLPSAQVTNCFQSVGSRRPPLVGQLSGESYCQILPQ